MPYHRLPAGVPHRLHACCLPARDQLSECVTPSGWGWPDIWSNKILANVSAAFTVCVFYFQLNGLDSCEQVSHDLGITETDMNRTTPLLLELVKRGRHREKASIFSAGEEGSHSDTSLNFVSLKGKGQGHVVSRHSDPLPKPQNLRLTGLASSVHPPGEQQVWGGEWAAAPWSPFWTWPANGVLQVGGSHAGESHHKDLSGSRNDDDVDYDDDFNSHPSDISKSEVSIGGEIEEVSVEGPDNSNKVSGCCCRQMKTQVWLLTKLPGRLCVHP
ncbi:uncharacterized protein LOC110522507 isoform X2 [Oncorhynchus mykiss]|uniref:uncharacterized protein LOC110522507 isoform X2 n=1 Tax=Oncorhynchus mykiss TaxID=8022 RepID=UPI001878841F|nr:uncharacterized protein LOC110522507 isoform X2 [Oncorhynchus mykiss]